MPSGRSRHARFARIAISSVLVASLSADSLAEIYTWTGNSPDQSTNFEGSYAGLFSGITTNTNSNWTSAGVLQNNWRLPDGTTPTTVPGSGDVAVIGEGFASGNPRSTIDRALSSLRINAPSGFVIDFRNSVGSAPRTLQLETGALTMTSTGQVNDAVRFAGNIQALGSPTFDISGLVDFETWGTVFAPSLVKSGSGNYSMFGMIVGQVDAVIGGDVSVTDGVLSANRLTIGGDITVGDGVGTPGSARFQIVGLNGVSHAHVFNHFSIRSDGMFVGGSAINSATSLTLNGGTLIVGNFRAPEFTLSAAPTHAGQLGHAQKHDLLDASSYPELKVHLAGATADETVTNWYSRVKASVLTVDGTGMVVFADPPSAVSPVPFDNDISTSRIESGTIKLARALDANVLGNQFNIGKPGETRSARVWIAQAGQIPNTSSVSLFANGRLTVFDNTLASISFSGGGMIDRDASLGGGGLALTASQTTMTGSGTATIGTTSLTLPAVHTIDVGTGGTLMLDTVVNGTSLTKSGAGTLQLGGTSANALTSLVHTAGTVTLAKVSGMKAVSNSLTVGTSGQMSGDLPTLRWNASNQIPDNLPIALRSGLVDLNGFNEALGGLGATGNGDISLITGAGTLTLTGNSSFTASTFAQVNGNLDLNAGSRTFTASGASGFTNALFKGAINNGTFIKSGGGDIYFNTLVGDATLQVNAGTAVIGTATFGALAGTGNLEVQTALTINSANASTYNGPLTGSGKLIKTGNAKLTLGTTSNTLAGGIELTNGSLDITSPTALGAAPPKLANFRLLTLAVPGASAARFTHGPSTLATFSHIDVGDDGLIVDYSGTSPQSAYRNLVALKRNGGAWNEIGGLFSSLIFADPNRISIGVAEASAIFTGAGPFTWRGQSVDSTSLFIAATILGDTNLDGTVNFDDLLKLAQNYGGAGKTWVQGDTNYDGNVNFDDLLKLAQVYGSSLAVDAGGLSPEQLGDSSFMRDLPLALALAPEPTGLCALSAGAMLGRRSRRQLR